jgi:hypothetical protein
MKINQITISNVLGIARADLTLKNAVTLLAGDNAAGKSTIGDCLSMAMLGKPARVDLKKNLGQVLHNDAEKGRVNVALEGIEDPAEFRLPKGEHYAPEISGAVYLPFVLRPSLFAEIGADERRTMLFGLTGIKASGKLIADKLAERGVSAAMIEDFAPMLRGGFPAASKEAYSRATASKGAWRAITGQTWGSVVAEDWSAQKPEGKVPAKEELDELLAKVAKHQKNREDGLAFIGHQQGLSAATNSHKQRLNDASETAELLPRRQAKLAETQKDLAGWEAKLPELLETLAECRAGAEPIKCPCCDEDLRLVDGKLEKFSGLKADTSRAQALALDVTKAKAAIDLLKRTLHNDIASVSQAESAAQQFQAIADEVFEKVDQDKLDRAQDSVEKLAGLITDIRAEFNTKQQMRFDAEGCGEKTEKAAKAHAEVKAWLSVGDALAPDGIPGELLADAMAPVNQSMLVLAGICGWSHVEIDTDMAVTFGGRMYGLCSESEQWRADCLIALAIAQISQLRLVVLDRFDVLDLKSRTALLMMLIKLGKLESMDTMILSGTLKALPALPPTVGGVWIENGIAELTA